MNSFGIISWNNSANKITAFPLTSLLIGGALALSGAISSAQEPKPAPTPAPLVASLYAGSHSLLWEGENKHAQAFSRLQVDYLVTRRLHAFGQGDLSTQGTKPDEAAAAYTTVEARGGLYVDLGRIAPGCMYGYSLPLEKGSPGVGLTEWACGSFLGKPRGRRWAFVGGGQNHAIGTKVLPRFGYQWPIGGEVYAMGRGDVDGPATRVLAGVAIRTGGVK